MDAPLATSLSRSKNNSSLSPSSSASKKKKKKEKEQEGKSPISSSTPNHNPCPTSASSASRNAATTDGSGTQLKNSETLQPTDVELMVSIQDRNPEALAALYDRYSGILKSLIMAVIHNEAEAEDLLQEIYMEIWRQAAHYSVQKGKPLGWIVTLTRRRSIDRLRKKQAYARAEERLQNETEQQPDAWLYNTTEIDIAMSDTRRLLLGVLQNLPAAQRQAIEFAFYYGMSQREIAAKTGIPLGTIKTRLELGLKKISDALKGMRDEF